MNWWMFSALLFVLSGFGAFFVPGLTTIEQNVWAYVLMFIGCMLITPRRKYRKLYVFSWVARIVGLGLLIASLY